MEGNVRSERNAPTASKAQLDLLLTMNGEEARQGAAEPGYDCRRDTLAI